ncbi:efflux RND transporter permease subunit [Membranicola marinus]|uniref:Efflux RND transporter permease subunit n=1 Tax=Membranihabitans marinus TaxID=1227546 RepID=A0A953L8W1_9BACT|nr:efflux RND transporter permease subunit [Membranihabitans marinus]
MIKYLIHKPVSVLMSFLAILLLAVFSIRQIAITLLPDIDIPTISIIATYPDHSAAEIEQSVMAPLRQNIQQVGSIDRLESKASDEQGRLTVHFPYGKDIDLAEKLRWSG